MFGRKAKQIRELERQVEKLRVQYQKSDSLCLGLRSELRSASDESNDLCRRLQEAHDRNSQLQAELQSAHSATEAVRAMAERDREAAHRQVLETIRALKEVPAAGSGSGPASASLLQRWNTAMKAAESDTDDDEDSQADVLPHSGLVSRIHEIYGDDWTPPVNTAAAEAEEPKRSNDVE